MPRSTYLAISATAVAGLFLAACSSTGTVPASVVADQVRQQLADQFGFSLEEMPKVTCPGELEAVMGALMTCSLIGTDGTFDVAVTVTSVDGGVASFSIAVADEPN
ncbi:MAG: DUF4333 domain-containing protein [Candidatus Nanopelagicales bacterium]